MRRTLKLPALDSPLASQDRASVPIVFNATLSLCVLEDTNCTYISTTLRVNVQM